MAKSKSKVAKKHSSRGWRQDQLRRSSEPWERGVGAPRKGNPNYKPVKRKTSSGKYKKVYVLRKKSKSKKRSSKKKSSKRH